MNCETGFYRTPLTSLFLLHLLLFLDQIVHKPPVNLPPPHLIQHQVCLDYKGVLHLPERHQRISMPKNSSLKAKQLFVNTSKMNRRPNLPIVTHRLRDGLAEDIFCSPNHEPVPHLQLPSSSINEWQKRPLRWVEPAFFSQGLRAAVTVTIVSLQKPTGP